jgi:hypothetical protein
MKITINIDISGEEIGEILKGTLMGAKKEVAERSKTKTPAKFRKINRKVRYGGKNLDIDEEFAAQQKIAAEVDKTHPSLLKDELPKKRGRGRPRLTPEQKLERRKAKKLALKKPEAKVVKTKPSKVVKRRWTTQEVAWLQTVAMKGKRKSSIDQKMVKKFKKQFGYERSLKSLEMKAQDLLGKRDKYRGKKYGKRK